MIIILKYHMIITVKYLGKIEQTIYHKAIAFMI